MDHATITLLTPAPAPAAAARHTVRTTSDRTTTRWVQLDALRVFGMLAIFSHFELADVD